jgi:hypothetical protein
LNWQERNPVQLADKGWKRKGKKAKRRNNWEAREERWGSDLRFVFGDLISVFRDFGGQCWSWHYPLPVILFHEYKLIYQHDLFEVCQYPEVLNSHARGKYHDHKTLYL